MKRTITFLSAILLLLFFQLTTMPVNAINPSADVESTFNQGDKVLNLGLGLGSTLYRGRYYTTSVPPISASLEVGVMEDFIVEDLTLGVGGYLGFSSSRYRWRGLGSEWGWNYNYIIVGGRAAVHYPLVEKLDTYTGLMMGINIVTSTTVGDVTGSASSGGLVYSWYAGGRYYLNDSFAVMGELGYGISYLTLGIALKF